MPKRSISKRITVKEEIFKKFKGVCYWCGTNLEWCCRGIANDVEWWFENGTRKMNLRWFVIDHVTPLKKNGKDSIENLVASCRSCNSKKSSKLDFTRLYG